MDVYIHSTTFLEDHGVLHPDNEIHLYSLDYAFLPRSNQCLKLFVNSSNLKPLSSARNKSPTQLWIQGLLQIYHSSHPVAQELSGQLDFMTGVGAMITVIL